MNAAILLSVLPLLAPLGGDGDVPLLSSIPAAAVQPQDDGEVRVWLAEPDDLLRRGDRARVSFRADERGFVTVVRIDTDGELHILFPDSPHDDGWVDEGRTYHAWPFRVDDDHGVGYVFAVWSPDPFDYHQLRERDRWGYRLASWRVRGDPYIAADDFARQIIERSSSYYSLDVDEYSVGGRYSYPRFMCYDCHAARSYHTWDPYSHRCVSIRLIVYDDPYYYPYRRYRGRRVVYARPRYEFKEVRRGERVTPDNYIERRRRVASGDTRRPGGTVRPGDDRPSPRPTDPRPGDDGPRPGGGGPRPDGDGPRPGGDGGGTIPPGHGGTPPGQGGTPPGQGNDPPSQGGTPPGHQGTPPGQGGTPPGRRDERRAQPRAADARPTEVRRVESSRDEPRRDEARRAEPRRSEPRSEPRRETRSEPRRETRSEPRAEPRRTESPRAEPRRSESSRSEPRRAEPKRSEPSRSEPRRPSTERRPR